MKSVFVAILAVFVSVTGVLGMYLVQRHFDRQRAMVEADQQFDEILRRVDDVVSRVTRFADEFAAGPKTESALNAAASQLSIDPDFLWAEWLSRSSAEGGEGPFVVRKVSCTGDPSYKGAVRELTGAMAYATKPHGYEGDRVFLSKRLHLSENDGEVFAAVRPICDQHDEVTGLAVVYFRSNLNPLKDESAVSMEIFRCGSGNNESLLARAGGRGKGPVLDRITTRGPERYRFLMKERESQVVKRSAISLFGFFLWPIVMFAFGHVHWKQEARRFRSQCFDLNNEVNERREMQRTLQSLLALRERERKTVSSDIHDGFVQEVVSAQMFLESLSARVNAADKKTQTLLMNLQQTIEQAIVEGRRLVNRNQLLAVDELGFLPALHGLLADLREKFDQRVTLHHADDVPDLDILQQRCVYRIIQEALTNVRRHSGVKEAVVSMYLQGNDLCVDISDDGKGFDMKMLRPDSYGIQSMSQRVEALGGNVRIYSELGEGTLVSAQLPLSFFVSNANGPDFVDGSSAIGDEANGPCASSSNLRV